MRVRYIGNYYKIRLIKGNIYNVISSENGWYQIVDELGDEGFYSPDQFEKVELNNNNNQGAVSVKPKTEKANKKAH